MAVVWVLLVNVLEGGQEVADGWIRSLAYSLGSKVDVEG